MADEVILPSEVIDRLEELARAASPGPWELYKSADARPHQVAGPTAWRPHGAKCAVIVDVPHYGYDAPEARDEQTANAAFIAEANPATILSLLAEVRASRQAGEREKGLREALDDISEGGPDTPAGDEGEAS